MTEFIAKRPSKEDNASQTFLFWQSRNSKGGAKEMFDFIYVKSDLYRRPLHKAYH